MVFILETLLERKKRPGEVLGISDYIHTIKQTMKVVFILFEEKKKLAQLSSKLVISLRGVEGQIQLLVCCVWYIIILIIYYTVWHITS